MLRFESIGCDCEFGLVQRRYDAEPLALLRWTAISGPGLLRGLANRFEGLGDPGTTELSVLAHSGEYYLSAGRYGLVMHTFINESHTAADTLYPKMCMRLIYLKDKFLADLTAADKICVFKCVEGGLDLILAIHERLRTFGPVRLLGVLEAGAEGGEAGEVRRIRPGLFVGFLERFGDPDGSWDILYDQWVGLCRATEALAEAQP